MLAFQWYPGVGLDPILEPQPSISPLWPSCSIVLATHQFLYHHQFHRAIPITISLTHSWCGPPVGIILSIGLQSLACIWHQIEGVATWGQGRQSVCKHNWVCKSASTAMKGYTKAIICISIGKALQQGAVYKPRVRFSRWGRNKGQSVRAFLLAVHKRYNCNEGGNTSESTHIFTYSI